MITFNGQLNYYANIEDKYFNLRFLMLHMINCICFLKLSYLIILKAFSLNPDFDGFTQIFKGNIITERGLKIVHQKRR